MSFEMNATMKKAYVWAGLLITALMALNLVYTATLNAFYGSGDMTDGAWLATVAWHNNIQLNGPPAFWESFFKEHVSPIFWLTNIISYILPLSKFDFFAVVLGATYALFATGIFRLWQLGIKSERPSIAATFVMIVVALAASFSGVGMQALRLPHHEMMFPAFAVWFLISLIEKKYNWASLCFCLALMVREDMGFHLFGVLFLTLMVFKFTRITFPQGKLVWRYALAAFVYAVLMMLFKNFVFSEVGGGVFQRSYIGSPPWHHITADLLQQRWDFYVASRGYIYLPFALTCIWAAIIRNPLLPVGYLAFVPWLLLSFFATNDTTATLSYYYGFPFWLSLAWPLVAIHLWPTASKFKLGQKPYILVLLASLIVFDAGHWTVYPFTKCSYVGFPFQPSDGLINRDMTEKFVDYFIKNEKTFEQNGLGMDMAVQALVVDHSSRDSWLQDLQDKNVQPSILIYYQGGYQGGTHVLPLLKSGLYNYFYEVPGTPVRLASQHELSQQLPAPLPFSKTDYIVF